MFWLIVFGIWGGVVVGDILGTGAVILFVGGIKILFGAPVRLDVQTAKYTTNTTIAKHAKIKIQRGMPDKDWNKEEAVLFDATEGGYVLDAWVTPFPEIFLF